MFRELSAGLLWCYSMLDTHLFAPFMASLSQQISDDEGPKEILLWLQRQIHWEATQHVKCTQTQSQVSAPINSCNV